MLQNAVLQLEEEEVEESVLEEQEEEEGKEEGGMEILRMQRCQSNLMELREVLNSCSLEIERSLMSHLKNWITVNLL